MARLRSIVDTCVPRNDVLSGHLADNHFAAQLDQIVRDPEGYPVYGDAEQFFALTHPTKGLKALLRRAFGRLSGANIEGAEQAIIRLETSFGGGKTHNLIAMHHLATGARPSRLKEFVDPDLLPADCQVSAVVADTLDPLAGLETNGVRTYTMWGEMAAQLGSEAYEHMRAADEGRTAPGKSTWEAVVGDRPTMIIIDEIAQHLRQLTSSGNEAVRRMAEAIPVFIRNLFEFAAGRTNVVVILTLATRRDAYGKETDEISAMIAEAEGRFSETFGDTQSVVTRFTKSALKPAEDDEIAEILKQRLFSSVDEGAASATGDEYRSYFEELKARGTELSGGAESPVTYAEAISKSYPFHPELIRVLDNRVGAIPNFQRARGALRLLAEVISGLWEKKSDAEILNVANIDLANPDVLSQLTVGLGRSDFEGVAKVDFAGDESFAARIDAERFSGRRPYARRACTTVFLHSLEMVPTAGAGRGDYLLGTLAVGDEPEVISQALAEVERVAWHLAYDGARWRFAAEPNANRIISEEMRNVPGTRVNEELEDRIKKAFPSDGPIKSVHFPVGPGSVADRAALQLCVFHHDDLSLLEGDALPPPGKVLQILDRAGASEGIRGMRNGVVFVVAAADQVEAARERVRASIAASSLVEQPGRLDSFSDDVRKRIREAADEAKLQARVAIGRCFKHLYFPVADAANSHLRHLSLSPRSQGEAQISLTKIVHQTLSEEDKIRTTRIGTDYLKRKAWPPGQGKATTSSISEYFWRDHGAKIVLDVTLLRDAIRDGISNEDWVYYDVQAKRCYTRKDPPAPVEFSSDHFLYTLDAAKEEGILGRELRWEDVSAALGQGVASGAALRAALEQQLDRSLTKGEIQEVVARAAEGGDSARLVAVRGEVEPGVKACTPAEIQKFSLDELVLLTPEKADERQVVRRETRRKTTEEAKGAGGPAFVALREKLNEIAGIEGIQTLSVTAAAEPGEGSKDISLLGKAIGMLPRIDIEVELSLELEFKNLTGTTELGLRGPAADYQRVEDAVLRLANAADDVAGAIRLDLRFQPALDAQSQDYERIRTVISDLSPGEVRLKAVMAWPDEQ